MGVFQPRRGDIFIADLSSYGAVRGCRPVIIIQNNMGNISSGSVVVATVTSVEKKSLPTHVALSCSHGLLKPSTALLEDILTIDKQCLLKYVGTVKNTETETKLDEAIRISLGIE